MFDGADVKDVSVFELLNSGESSTTAVVDMEGMFHYATNTNKIVKKGYNGLTYFESVTSTRRMFAGTNAGCLHKSSFPACLDMSEMFAETNGYTCVAGESELVFNDVSKVTTVKGMFKNSEINKKIANPFPDATDFSEMYMNAVTFNQAISGTKLGGSLSVTSTRDMFRGATKFNAGNGNGVKIRSEYLEDASGMFAFTSYNGADLTISSQVLTDTSHMFENSSYNVYFRNEDVETGLVRNMDCMFKNANIFSKGTQPKHMFGYTTSHDNSDFPNSARFELNLTSVTSMRQTFMGLGVRERTGTNNWGSNLEFTATSALTDISGIFQGSVIDRETDGRYFMTLNVPGVKDVSNMFAGANVKDKKITISSTVITDFRNMFNGFSGDLSLDPDSDSYLDLNIDFNRVKVGSDTNIDKEGVKGMFYNTIGGITNADLISFYDKYQFTKIKENKVYDDTGIFSYYNSGNNVVRDNFGTDFTIEGTDSVIAVSDVTIIGFGDIIYERYEAPNVTFYNTTYSYDN